MNDPVVAVVSIEEIGVEEGHNPRTTFDPAELAALEASLVATDGLVQPLAVQPASGEPVPYTLIDGERRLRALRALGVEKVPVLVLQSRNAKLAATAANVARVPLNDIERAVGIKATAELEGLKTIKEIAARTGFSEPYVGQHLRLLKLPPSVQAHIAAGHVPAEAERSLRKASRLSVRLAECACELVEREVIEGRDLVRRFGEVVVAVAESDLPGKPTMIDMSRPEPLGFLLADPNEHAALVERYRAATGRSLEADPVIGFSTAEVDAARAAGCLVEFPTGTDWRGEETTTLYLTDAALAADLASRVIERIEREAAEAARAAAAEQGADPDEDPAVAAQKAKDAKREERRKARREGEAAHERNTALGRALIAARGAKNRRENRLAWAKAVAAVLLRDNANLPAAGLGLAFEQLQTVEHKTVKASGEQQKQVTYAYPEKCGEYLWGRIEEAKSADQVLELLGEALVAAVAVDPTAVPRSRRVSYWLRSEREVGKILAEQVKALRPRRRARKRA